MIRTSLALGLSMVALTSCGGSSPPTGGTDSGALGPDSGGLGADAATAVVTHDCEEADYVDLTGGDDMSRTIGVPAGTFNFDNACITVRAGQSVTFAWDFVLHPLGVGVAPGHRGTETEPSPIVAQTTGTSQTTTFPTAGDYPFYCVAHFHSSGMYGVVRVVP